MIQRKCKKNAQKRKYEGGDKYEDKNQDKYKNATQLYTQLYIIKNNEKNKYQNRKNEDTDHIFFRYFPFDFNFCDGHRSC